MPRQKYRMVEDKRLATAKQQNIVRLKETDKLVAKTVSTHKLSINGINFSFLLFQNAVIWNLWANIGGITF